MTLQSLNAPRQAYTLLRILTHAPADTHFTLTHALNEQSSYRNLTYTHTHSFAHPHARTCIYFTSTITHLCTLT